MIWAPILIVIIVEKKKKLKHAAQSMVVNVKLVAFYNLQATSIPQPSELMKIRGRG